MCVCLCECVLCSLSFSVLPAVQICLETLLGCVFMTEGEISLLQLENFLSHMQPLGIGKRVSHSLLQWICLKKETVLWSKKEKERQRKQKKEARKRRTRKDEQAAKQRKAKLALELAEGKRKGEEEEGRERNRIQFTLDASGGKEDQADWSDGSVGSCESTSGQLKATDSANSIADHGRGISCPFHLCCVLCMDI